MVMSKYQVIRKVLRFVVLAMQAVLAVAAEKPRTAGMTSLKAQELYDDDLISGSEYAEVIRGENRQH